MAAGTKVQLRLGDRVVAEVPFEGAELRIGRMKENDLVINNLAVSRFHAVLRRVGDAFEIEDLGSENGTFVESIAVRGRAVVPPNAAITIGKHTLSLRSGSQGPAQPTPATGRSDVWDAGRTYLLAGSPSRTSPSHEVEAVAVAIDAAGDEGAGEIIEAVEEVDDALHSGEDALLGAAAHAAGSLAEPAELEELSLSGPLEGRSQEAGRQTALFDFGLTDELGISERSLARAAQARTPAPPPAPAPAPAAPAPTPASAAAPRHAGLIVERAGRVERVMPWGTPALVVGRAPDCDLVLAASGVSRRHARFVREGQAFRVIDLGSANGILVNGKGVDSYTLSVGDVVGIDDYAITFVLDREPVEGIVRAAKSPAASGRRHGVFQTDARYEIQEHDLLFEPEDESAPTDADKVLERVAPQELVQVVAGADPAWRLEITVAAEQLPEELRRALSEVGEDELRLPAELRVVRKA